MTWTTKLNTDAMTLDIINDNGVLCGIELRDLVNSAEVLDTLLHLQGKNWCSSHLLCEILDQLNAAFRRFHGDTIQGVVCPFGLGKRITWPDPEDVSRHAA